ncbi:ABC transporter ATP-binding protein [Nocardiopsis flavescens]|uniref:ABC-2 type transport system ATP-binding protein n=1 Tax=Nocardiopsis flavescens TaxID=758803 RepID=A0A1M6N8F0_9ACTN|nr:ABC transporter ATP-binding protein [Nocardiopsis flavescens]SHJ91927.1 ABC-2 type transport system ATP-binding protein [Nocardiopsis flavescens]
MHPSDTAGPGGTASAATSTDHAIDASGITKDYGKGDVLHGIDYRVPTGTVSALLGPNGAGKTTLIEILEGHRGRTSGRLSVLGLDPGDRRDFARLRTRMSVVLQQTVLEPGLSVRDILRRHASYHPDPVGLDEILDQVDLTAKRSALVKSLSGGQLRRLDLALALTGRPELLFLDEPTTGLDPVSRRRIRALVSGLRDSGTTVVLTSHDLAEVQELADRVDVIRDGAFLATGTPDELVRSSSAFTVVEFADPGVAADRLPDGANLVNGRVRIHTDDQDTVVRDVQAWAEREKATISGLTIVPPTLDDAYLAMLDAGAQKTTSGKAE